MLIYRGSVYSLHQIVSFACFATNQLKFFLLYLLLVSSVLMERSCILEINQVLNLRIRPDFDLAKRIRKIVIEVINIRQ